MKEEISLSFKTFSMNKGLDIEASESVATFSLPIEFLQMISRNSYEITVDPHDFTILIEDDICFMKITPEMLEDVTNMWLRPFVNFANAVKKEMRRNSDWG